MKSKKVIVFHQEFYFSGGAEHTLFDVMDFFRNEGYEAEAWSPTVNRRTCFPDRISKYRVYSLLPEWVTVPRELRIVLACLLFPFVAYRFNQADFFYGANQSGPFFAWVASVVCGKPYMVYMPYPQGFLFPRRVDLFFARQSQDMSFLYRLIVLVLKPVYTVVDRKIISDADVVMSEGRYATSLFREIYQREVVNSPPVDTRGSDLVMNESYSERPYILITNRHVPKKMFELAIHAYAVSEVGKSGSMDLVISGGRTEYTGLLEKYARDLGVHERILFVGYTTESEMTKLYKHASLYVYPAPEEDFGKGIVEAQAWGIPVIGWDAAGPGGIIEHEKTGILCIPYDYVDMAGQIDRLSQDKVLYKKIANECLARSKALNEQRESIFREALVKLHGSFTL